MKQPEGPTNYLLDAPRVRPGRWQRQSAGSPDAWHSRVKGLLLRATLWKALCITNYNRVVSLPSSALLALPSVVQHLYPVESFKVCNTSNSRGLVKQ